MRLGSGAGSASIAEIHGKQDQGPAAEGRDAGEGGPEISPDSPLPDLSDAAIKKLIHSAKKRGYVTHDQINALLSSEEVKSEQIEDILAKFSEMGVNVVETEEAEPEIRSRARRPRRSPRAAS